MTTLFTARSDEATSILKTLLPNKQVHKDHPLTTDESQLLHVRTKIDKTYSTKLVPANAFWVICITGDCIAMDLSDKGKSSMRYCAWRANHVQKEHKNTKELKCIIHSYFEFSNGGKSWGTEYMQLEQLNKHSYKYYNGDLIELNMDENVNENDNDNENGKESNNNKNENDDIQVLTNTAADIADQVVKKLNPKLEAALKSHKFGCLLSNNNNNNNNKNIYALRVEADNFMDFIETEGKGVFDMLFIANRGFWRVFCIACHRFHPSKKTWSKGKEMTSAEATDHRYLFVYVFSFVLFAFVSFCFVLVLVAGESPALGCFVLFCFVLFCFDACGRRRKLMRQQANLC